MTIEAEIEGKKQVLEADRLLVCIGMRPNSETLGLDMSRVVSTGR